MAAFVAEQNHALYSAWNVLKPDKMKDLFRKHEDQGSDYLLMIRALGWQKETSQEMYSHWEENRVHSNFMILADVNGQAAGDSVDVTIHPDSLDANNRFYVRVGDIIPFSEGTNRIMGTVIAIDVAVPAAPVVTIAPNRLAETIPDLSADDTLFIISNAHGEGSDQPDPRISDVDEIYNKLMIIKEDIASTGTAITDGLWFDIPWAKGSGAPAGSYYRKALVDLDYRVGLSIGGALQFDVPTNNPAIVDAVEGTPRNQTFGLFPAANLYGYTDDYVPGALTVGSFDLWSRTFTRENVTNSEAMLLMGDDLCNEMENLMVDYLAATNVDYTRNKTIKRLFNGSANMEVVVGFSYLTKANRTFAFKVNYDYSNVTTYASEGYNYSRLGILIPMGKSKDQKTGEMVGSIGYRYKKLGDYSREFEMWDTGSANVRNKTNTIDKKRTSVRCHIGAQQIAANRFIVLEPIP